MFFFIAIMVRTSLFSSWPLFQKTVFCKIITTGRAGGLHRPPWGLLPAEPIGSSNLFRLHEMPCCY